MAIDFSLSPELEEIRDRVRTLVDDVVKPAEAEIARRALDGPIARVPQRLIVDAHAGQGSRASGCRTCRQSGAAWGSGHVELAMVAGRSGEGRASGRSSINAQAPDEGNMHTLLHWGTDEQKEKYLRPLCEGTAAVVLRHDRARGRRLRPDAHQDVRLPRRRRVGHQRPQVVHLRRAPGASSPSSSPAPRRTPTSRRPPTPRSSSTSRARAGPIVRDDRDDARPGTATARSASRTCACRTSNMLGGHGQGHLLGQYRLGPARLAHCMRWIAPGRDRARHDGRPLAQPLLATARCSPRSRASSG